MYLDADTLVFQNIDELMLLPELSAAMDEQTLLSRSEASQNPLKQLGFEAFFNSGVMVLRPDNCTLEGLLETSTLRHLQMGFGDQDVLNVYFRCSVTPGSCWLTAGGAERAGMYCPAPITCSPGCSTGPVTPSTHLEASCGTPPP